MFPTPEKKAVLFQTITRDFRTGLSAAAGGNLPP